MPYKGTGPAITELVGGQVQTMITGVVALMPHIKSGKLRGLAVTRGADPASNSPEEFAAYVKSEMVRWVLL